MPDSVPTPWEMACEWYSETEIATAVAFSYSCDKMLGNNSPTIPRDTGSQEFATWLTEQYRLAMAKGIELERRRAAN